MSELDFSKPENLQTRDGRPLRRTASVPLRLCNLASDVET
jgi:hypothetical protein